MIFPQLLPTLLLLPALASALPQVETLVDLAAWGASALSSTPRKSANFPDGGWSWVDCGGAGDAVLIDSIKVSPDPPVPGQNLTVTATGLVVDPITDGAYADVLVKLGLIKLLQRKFDVCETAAENNATIQCPVAPGVYEVVQTVELPKEIPKAKYSVQVRGFTAEEKDMVCVNLFIDFLTKRDSN
ncbi:ML domain-containing protein [Mrakia frigida]|uniref:ML domain-containing protein n=1 Tax=Mrakia frigida TaxID=29902 RepID=UPI003FCC17C6